MQTLNQTVVAAGRVFAAGTARSDAEGVPDGPWWDGEAQSKQGARKAPARKSDDKTSDAAPAGDADES